MSMIILGILFYIIGKKTDDIYFRRFAPKKKDGTLDLRFNSRNVVGRIIKIVGVLFILGGVFSYSSMYK